MESVEEHFSICKYRGPEKINPGFYKPLPRGKYRLFFVVNGYLVCKVDLNSIRINKKDFHISTFRQILSLETVSRNIECYYCCFDADFLERVYLNDKIEKEIDFVNSFLSYYPLRLNDEVCKRIKSCFANMDTLYGEEHPDWDLIHLYLLTLIYEAKKLILDEGIEIYPTRPYLTVKKYADLLSENILNHREVKFYAHALHITPNHLNKSVKEVTGDTAVSMMNRMTLLEAKSRLKNTALSISEIAYDLGFSDLSYFSKFFKRETGQTPLDYRKNE